ncbi:MAG: hypothetical protein U0325_12120 [Polyangiales bacterium]
MRPAVVAAALATALAAGSAGAQSLTDMDWFVLEPSVGLAYANITAFDNSGIIPGITNSSGFGPSFGLTAGMRFSIVTLAAHVDLSRFDPYDVGTVGGRVQVHIPLPIVKPFVRLGAGCAWLGAVSASAVADLHPGLDEQRLPRASSRWSASLGAF